MKDFVIRVRRQDGKSKEDRVAERDRILGEAKTSLGDSFNIVAAEPGSVMAHVSGTPEAKETIKQKYPGLIVEDIVERAIIKPPFPELKK